MLLTLEGVDAYYGKSQALRDISVEIGEGEIVALLGRNGSGRSTTLKTIMGIVAPAAGRVRFGGEPLNGLPPFRIARRGIAYVPEERRCFPGLTVAENLKMASLRGRKGPWTVERVFKLLPRLGERHSQLVRGMSGGEQQMLAVARALIANPSLILLDEPLEGLAPVVAQAIVSMLRVIRDDGMTVLLVEQHLEVALDLAHRGYVLSTGRIVASGPSEQLRDDEQMIRRYLAV